MKFNHLEFLIEEDSAEVALSILLPRLLPSHVTWTLHPFQGKSNLLANLPGRLRGYRQWLPADWGIVVLLDEDRQDCVKIKTDLETIAHEAGFQTKSAPAADGQFEIINRLCIEELEAWFFGDVPALRKAYPGVPATLASQRGYRVPDAISGGTWEALERVLQKAGYHQGGLAKKQAARDIAIHMEPSRNQSSCFQTFRNALQSVS